MSHPSDSGYGWEEIWDELDTEELASYVDMVEAREVDEVQQDDC